MLLLYQCQTLYIVLCTIYLHSTMLLLYPVNRAVRFTKNYQIYIPLCFYFISSSIWLTHLKLKFTFHYASTLSCTEPSYAVMHSLFTFHYASTLSIRYVPRELWDFHLHSTMLLLYRSPSVFNRDRVPHLHSTMLLLYPALSTHDPTKFVHLHSTMLLLYRKHRNALKTDNSIYIPLCFYFIVLHRVWLQHINLDLHSTMLLLYLWLVFGSIGLRTHLHSTMLLLYPQCQPPVIGPSEKIYIPLCFYFINRCKWTSGRDQHLHSTMLLLYRTRTRQKKMPGSTFTFHYASTLSIWKSWLSNSGFSIYIPLCFYFILRPLPGS